MKISQEKVKKIKEGILSFLFHSSPRAIFTSQIAVELARDEEFSKKLLSELQKDNLVVAIKKNPKGKDYSRRIRWRLTNQTYKTYKSLQQSI